MASFVFSVNGPKQVILGSFNIHGCRNKLESHVVSSWIRGQDIVFLCETMTTNPIYVPGYTVFYGNDTLTTTNRGGTALLVKNNIAEYIYVMILLAVIKYGSVCRLCLT